LRWRGFTGKIYLYALHNFIFIRNPAFHRLQKVGHAAANLG
jgi:hypothetical protein